MKRKVVLALVATLTLTVGSIGTVFAMNNSQGITIQISELSNHEHVWGAKQWVVDKEAVYETVHHPAETHEEEQWVVDKEAWTETIEHPAETHEEQQWVVDQEAWDEQVIVGYHSVCNECGQEYTGKMEHYNQYGCDSSKGYTSNVPIYDTIHHDEVGHWETVTIIDKEAWTETIEHPEEGHYETVTIVDKEAWDEEVLVSPEQGHWEHTCTDCGEVQNSETGEVITPGTDDPTTEEPETPDNTTDTGENKDQQNDNKTATETTNKSENTNTATTVSTENKAPKTGDTASMIYLATLAGSVVTGGTAFGLRRKFKK